MTLADAYLKAVDRYARVRLNKDGTRNGNAVHHIYQFLKKVAKENGYEHNMACTYAHHEMENIKTLLGK